MIVTAGDQLADLMGGLTEDVFGFGVLKHGLEDGILLPGLVENAMDGCLQKSLVSCLCEEG